MSALEAYVADCTPSSAHALLRMMHSCLTKAIHKRYRPYQGSLRDLESRLGQCLSYARCGVDDEDRVLGLVDGFMDRDVWRKSVDMNSEDLFVM